MAEQRSFRQWWAVLLTCAALQACGGGSGASPADAATAAGTSATSGDGGTDPARLRLVTGVTSPTVTGTSSPSPTRWVQMGPISDQDAARFLTQATFGPTPTDVAHLKAVGFDAWVSEQLAKPLPSPSHVAYFDMRNAEWMAYNPTGRAGPMDITDPVWRNAIAGDDQLRQRVALALSEIFVVSLMDTCNPHGRGYAAYLDMLERNAFGNFRQLLQDVTLHPIMGCFLSHVANQKDDPVTGRVPDENFAREVMQLFSIGLYQLNPDGTAVMSAGQPVPTYGPSDIAGLARVFTGFSWNCPLPYDDGCFVRGSSWAGMQSDPDMWIKPMVAYDRFHSPLAKTFLGKTFPAQDAANAWASLRFALDTLATHANVGPFLGRQLIQRLVTSNPSPAYVARVAQAFKSSGGNLGTAVQAVLMDPEARNTAAALASDSFGKVREPILRMTAVLRAVDGRSMTGRFTVGWTPDADRGLNQAPLMAPSVFNFFRPGYVAAGSLSAARGLVAPELQIANETSVAGYANFVGGMLINGLGPVPNFGAGLNGVKLPDVYLDFQRNATSSWRTLADDPAALVEALNQRLMYGTMSASLRQDLVSVVSNITDPHPEIRQPDRIVKALLVTLTSPEFLVQR
ncbi:MAG: DUF1800 domain-containing protein [Proteobacteria bacterium]|uniref:DUF1800 family protein n=1 Tax=Aquabacterium sp. TaxID=1872578 RepID=UPI0035C73AF5|nr:DUF1800 domain-containing protein [Pseudomonadota bacterium]